MLCQGNKAKEMLKTGSVFSKKLHELRQAEKCTNTTPNSLYRQFLIYIFIKSQTLWINCCYFSCIGLPEEKNGNMGWGMQKATFKRSGILEVNTEVLVLAVSSHLYFVPFKAQIYDI